MWIVIRIHSWDIGNKTPWSLSDLNLFVNDFSEGKTPPTHTFFQVLICLCEAAVSIAKDTENRSILIDYDLIPVLLRLCESVWNNN